MFTSNRYIISVVLLLLAINLPAQNLTGTWEGDLGNDQFLQLNILQTGNKICGYTYDRVKADKRSFCKAFFEGRYDKQKRMLIIDGKYFLQNSGSHTLMKLNLNYKKERGVEVLEERPGAARIFSDLFRNFNGNGMFEIDPFQNQTAAQYVYIKKVSDQPYEIIELMQDCIARDKLITDTASKVMVPKKRQDSLPDQVKMSMPQNKKDPATVPQPFSQRKNKEQSHLTVDVQKINLKVYDNAIMDGDTVSIFYNGKLLLSHQLLTEKGIEINLELDERQTRHEILLFAENLGSIPPNTALVVITAGEKRYELFASASLEENALLIFDYKPK